MSDQMRIFNKLTVAINEIRKKDSLEGIFNVLIGLGVDLLKVDSAIGGVIDGSAFIFKISFEKGKLRNIKILCDLMSFPFQISSNGEKFVVLKKNTEELKRYAEMIKNETLQNALIFFLYNGLNIVGMVGFHNVDKVDNLDNDCLTVLTALSVIAGLEVVELDEKSEFLEDHSLNEIIKYTEKVTDRFGILFVSLDTEMRIVTVNKYAENVTGYKKEKVIGKNALDMFVPEEFKKTTKERYLAEVRNKSTFWEVEVPIVCKDGKILWVVWHNSFLSGKGVKDNLVLVTGIDVTKRHLLEEALRESEERFRAMAENTSVAILIYQDNKFTYLNKTAQKIGGYREDEILGMNFWDAVHPEDREMVKERGFARQKGEKVPTNYEFRIITRDGHVKWVDFSAGFIMYKGRPGGLVTLVDITERKKSELALRESEERFRLLAESSPVGIYLLGKRLLYVNPAMSRTLGYSIEELLSIDPLETIYPEDREIVKKSIKALPSGEVNTINYNVRGIRKDGTIRWLEFFGSRVSYRGENAILGTLMDITERKKMEQKLRDSEKRYKALFHSASDLILLLKDNRVMECNPAVSRMLGFKESELIGKTPIDFSPEFQPDGVSSRVKAIEKINAALSGEPQLFYWTHTKSDGTTIETEVNLNRIELEGEFYLQAIVRDITEQKKLEEEQKRATKLESLGVLAGGLAHDFNNYLSGILGNISLARMNVEPQSELAELLADAEKATLNARSITKQLLTFSKGGAPIKKITDISQFLEDVTEFVLRGSKVKAKYQFQDDLPHVEIDPGQIQQVVQNILVNAIQAMPGGGTVSIRAEKKEIFSNIPISVSAGDYVVISIKDMGVGIVPEIADKIFDPYFTTKKEGSGLGLAVCFSIVKQHGGTITVESTPGKGSEFFIYLPVKKRKAIAKTDEDIKIPGKCNIKVLLMDDEETVRRVAEKMLSAIGCKVVTAVEGNEAIEIYRKYVDKGDPFDVVILDLTVKGGLGGKETIERLLEIDRDATVIVSSGYSNDPIMAEYDKYGFSGVIAKPYLIDDIKSVLCEVLSKRNKEKQ